MFFSDFFAASALSLARNKLPSRGSRPEEEDDRNHMIAPLQDDLIAGLEVAA